MPGTDYACAFGTPVLSAESGTVTRVIRSTASASGRQVYVRLDDGREVAYIHLSSTIYAVPGRRVGRGDVLALSGASGFGKEWGYAAHLHVTLWAGAAWSSRMLDFDTFVGPSGGTAGGGGVPINPDKRRDYDMARNAGIVWEAANPGGSLWSYLIHNTESGFGLLFVNAPGQGPIDGSFVNGLAVAYDTPSWAKVTESLARATMAALDEVRPADAPALLRVELTPQSVADALSS